MGKHLHSCNGLSKRCDCHWRKWAKCPHPWFLHFQWAKKEHRYQLNKLEGKPKGYVMGRTEAEGIRDRVCSEIRFGTFRHPKLGPAPTAPIVVDQRLTLDDVIKEYTKRHVWMPGRRQRGGQIMVYNLNVA